MFEKVNPSHPDKVADRIAGAIVDLCYAKNKNPKVACEVLIGHGECNIGDESVGGVPYAEIVEKARLYIHTLGGFEKFAMWGLIRPKE